LPTRSSPTSPWCARASPPWEPRLEGASTGTGVPPWLVSLLALHAAEAALAESGYVAQRVSECLALKAGMIARLNAPALPSATYYFLLDLKATGVAASRLLDCLRSRNIFLRDLAGFTAGSGDGLAQRFVRITTQGRLGNRRIAEELNRIISSWPWSSDVVGASRTSLCRYLTLRSGRTTSIYK
jgi:hypothetical protein